MVGNKTEDCLRDVSKVEDRLQELNRLMLLNEEIVRDLGKKLNSVMIESSPCCVGEKEQPSYGCQLFNRLDELCLMQINNNSICIDILNRLEI